MNQQLAIGAAIGIGCALLIPVVGIAVASGAARPAGRALLRGGTVLGEKTRETLAELGEVYEDFIAETRSGSEATAPASAIIETQDSLRQPTAKPATH
jgi:hypothetical protein